MFNSLSSLTPPVQILRENGKPKFPQNENGKPIFPQNEKNCSKTNGLVLGEREKCCLFETGPYSFLSEQTIENCRVKSSCMLCTLFSFQSLHNYFTSGFISLNHDIIMYRVQFTGTIQTYWLNCSENRYDKSCFWTKETQPSQRMYKERILLLAVSEILLSLLNI